MNTKEYLDKVAYVKEHVIPMGDDAEDQVSNAYFSKFDDSYITQVGMEDSVEYLAEREITDELTHGVGFSPKDGIYGFEVGSTCKKGNCHYRAANIEDELEAAVAFWSDEYKTNVEANLQSDGTIHVKWKYDDAVPNEESRGKISGTDWRYDPNNFGRGEWTAKTMEDAKQMAVDFNSGVS